MLLGVAAIIGLIVLVVVMFDEPAGPGGGSGDAAVGATLYLRNCAVCHGTDLLGTVQGPPLLHQIYAPNHHSDEAFQRAVAFGVQPHHWDFGPMVPIPGLSRDEVAHIVAFVRQEQEAAGIFRDPSHP